MELYDISSGWIIEVFHRQCPSCHEVYHYDGQYDGSVPFNKKKACTYRFLDDCRRHVKVRAAPFDTFVASKTEAYESAMRGNPEDDPRDWIRFLSKPSFLVLWWHFSDMIDVDWRKAFTCDRCDPERLRILMDARGICLEEDKVPEHQPEKAGPPLSGV